MILNGEVITKAEFARRRGVSPGRVSQWISEGKLAGASLVGEGREQRVNEALACEQLRVRLNVDQMSGNGLTTNLAFSAAPSPAANPQESDEALLPPQSTSTAAAAATDEIGDAIKRGRLEQIERQNRAAQREELVSAGLLTDAAGIKMQQGREISRFVNAFDGALATFAAAIAAEFKLPQRDVLHLLRNEFRKFRAETAKAVRAEAENMPPLIDFDPHRQLVDA